MSKIEDMALIGRVLVFGDTQAFDKLVIKYQSSVRRFLLHLTHGDEMLSDDLAQDTFLKAYLNIHKFKGIAQFSTWLMRIAYNRYYDYHRKNQSIIEMQCTISLQNAAQIEIEDIHNDNFDIELLLKQLTPDEKATVLLYYMEDQSVRKIAQILSIPENSVKSHLFRARQKMKNQLQNNNHE